MPTARGFLAATTGPNGRIYAIGGDTTGSLNTVEAYDPATNTWRSMAPMPTARGGLAVATGSDGRIYAMGGAALVGGVIRTSLDTVEAYDPPTDTWSAVAPLLTPRNSPAAATGPDGRIYAVGGYDSSSLLYLNSVEAYTPELAASPTPSPMPTPALSPSATPTPTPPVVAVPVVSAVPGASRAATASFTVSFSSTLPGQGEVYFGSGPGCSGLVEVATHDLHPGTTQHTVVVTGNDLPGSVGNNGIVPGVTYWFEVVTVTRSGVEVETNHGHCYSATVPAR
jgi:hypothetical protein